MVEAIARQYSSRVGKENGNQKTPKEKRVYKERNLSQGLKQQVEKRILMSDKLTPRNLLKKSGRYDDQKIREVYESMYSSTMSIDEDQKTAYLNPQNRQQIIQNIKKIYQQLKKPPSSITLVPLF
jgi:hypothetical protein